MSLEELVDEWEMKIMFPQTTLPVTDSKEVFVSHDLDVCDNEEFAKRHWGVGYRRFVLDESFVP